MLKPLWKGSAPLTATTFLMIGALAVAAIGLAVDPRIITGAPAWLKPAKFAASVGIYTATLAWIFSLLPEWPRTRRIVGWTTAVALVLEIVLIDLQAFRGTTSHFNASTLLDGAIFTVMGVAIMVQTISTIWVAVALWRQRFQDRALGWALRLGMAITIVGALSGGLMPPIAAHTVGAPDGGPGLPGTGWSTEAGDLRVAHFAGLHAMQALPIVAVVLARRRVTDAARVRLVLTASASYTGLFAVLLTQALRGQSIVAPDALTIAALSVWGLGTAAAVVAAVAGDRHVSRTAVLN